MMLRAGAASTSSAATTRDGSGSSTTRAQRAAAAAAPLRARLALGRRRQVAARASGAPKVGAKELQKVAEAAAAAGAAVITAALDRPRTITSKGAIGDIGALRRRRAHRTCRVAALCVSRLRACSCKIHMSAH